MSTQLSRPLPTFSCCSPRNRDAELNSDRFVAYLFAPRPNPSDLEMPAPVLGRESRSAVPTEDIGTLAVPRPRMEMHNFPCLTHLPEGLKPVCFSFLASGNEPSQSWFLLN